jgi:hypothetical protein
MILNPSNNTMNLGAVLRFIGKLIFNFVSLIAFFVHSSLCFQTTLVDPDLEFVRVVSDFQMLARQRPRERRHVTHSRRPARQGYLKQRGVGSSRRPVLVRQK